MTGTGSELPAGWPPAADGALAPPMLGREPAEPLLAWAFDQLAALGYRITGEPEVRRRDWSTVVSVDTDRGLVWIKANARGFHFEAALLQLLAVRAGDHVLHPLAVQERRGWFLTPHGGVVLEDEGPPTQDSWVALLVGYVDLQRRIRPYAPELLRIGLQDMSPTLLGDWLDRTLHRAAAEEFVADYLPDEELVRLRALIPATAGWGAELAGDGIGVTVEHNDLHTGNVFSAGYAGSQGPRPTTPGSPSVPDDQQHDPRSVDPTGLKIFDWADAIVTHPFLALGRATGLPAEVQEEYRRDPGDRPPPPPIDVDVVRDAYVTAWTGGPVTARLRRSAALAEMLSDIALAASWLRLPLGMLPGWAEYFASFLTRYLRRAEAMREADLAGDVR